MKNLTEKIKEKTINASKKFLKTFGYLSILAGTLAVLNYNRTPSDLEITANSDGTQTYKHEDDHTTHLLNALAGRKKFTEQDMKIDFYRRYFKKQEIALKNISKLNVDELDKIISENDTTMKRGDLKEEFYRKLKMANNEDTGALFKPNKNIYELVWQLEKECGNPKIRISSGYNWGIPVRGNYYRFINNTMYISLGGIANDSRRDGWICEMSHAKQFKEKPVRLIMRCIFDYIKAVKNSMFNNESFSKEYKKLYSEPGSIEHEAHSIIEPYLEKKYPLFIKK